MEENKKEEILQGIIANYECGFITATELIIQIDSIDWNRFERIAIKVALEKATKFSLEKFKNNLR